ncbi:MAG: hypothetical protein M1812_006165 [Candelaria pacifica]|nr:MAG: hypothetical protein M1812_006165 [Candelaria pacifica]
MESVVARAPLNYLRGSLCAICLRRRPQPLITRIRLGIKNSNRATIRYKSDDSKESQTDHPVIGFYELLLDQPLSSTTAATSTVPTPPPPEQLPKTEKEERLAKARVVFGSRLAGPVERRSEIDKKSTTIAGILVPPRPNEPDNCCMSGCVNCVWDLYRDELEEWAAKSAEARTAMQKQRDKGKGSGMMVERTMPSHIATSMDDDGGGSETNWSAGLAGGEGGDLFGNIPVGIREFMRTEKKLKQKHMKEGTVGG